MTAKRKPKPAKPKQDDLAKPSKWRLQHGGFSEPVDDGSALLLGAGYEVLSAPNFSIDLQGRLLIGSYSGIDEQITSGTIGVGFNWF